MPLSGDISTALQLLEHIQHTIHASEDVKLESQTSNDLNLLISVLENPILRGIVTIQDSLCELNQQLQHHPSILPADFELSTAGELILSLPPSPPSSADIYDVGGGSRGSGVGTGSSGIGVGAGFEFEDQRVPVATLSNSSSSGENVSSPQTRVGQVSNARGVGGAKRGGVGGTHFMQLSGGREGSGDEGEEEEDDALAVGASLPQPPITTTAYAMEFQKAIGAASQGRDVHTIKLFKPEGSSLGFSVVGLRSEEKGELGIFVQEIQPTGIAGRDGRLQEGDQILAIDGQPLDSNISHHQAISILQKARGLVELVVARNASVPSSDSSLATLQPHLPSSPPPAQPSIPPQSSSSISSIPSVSSQPPPLPPPRSPTPTASSAQVPIERSPSAVSDTSKAGSEMVLNTEWAQVEVIDLLNDGSGLGFGIIGGRSTGVVVKTILPTGVADRDGRLQSGDHILQIGDVNLRGMGSEQVAAVLRQSGSHVRLVVARPVEPTSPDYQALGSHAPIVPTKILGDPEELDRQLLQNGYDADAAFSGPPPPLPIPINQLSTSVSSGLLQQVGLEGAGIPYDPQYTFSSQGQIVGDPVGMVTATSLTALEPLPEMEKFEVELRKDAHGLGITIAGYVCEKEELSGIFVKSISEGSAADLCGRIQVNDRIVEVDGRSLQGYTNHGAVEVLRGTGRTVRLCLERYLRGPKYEQLQQAIANSELLQGRQGLQQQITIQRQPLTTGMPSVPGPSGNSIASIGILPPPTPSSPSATSLPHVPLSSTDGEEETTEIEPEGESHTTIDSAVLLEGLGGLGEEGIVDDDDEIGGRATIEALNMDIEVERLINTCYEGELDSAVEAAVKAKWSKIMGPDCEIVVAQLSKFGEGGGLGISLEGTVDVEGGREVRPHHYIRSILPEGPVGRNGRLRSGDELLEVNGCRLLGLNHVEVVANLKELPVHVRMVCARKSPDAQPQHRLLIDTAQDRAAFAARSILGGSLQNLLPTTDRLVKAKSDGSLASSSTATATASSAAHTPGASHAPTTPTFSSPSSSSAPGSSSGPSGDVGAGDISLGLGVGGGLSAKMRSRSLEPLTGLAMWSSEPQVIELVKGERGLGFSILDYQDPMNPSETVIVIRSLVPGGVAQTDGRLVPGDRLLAVNEARLENASLDRAVQALKGAPRGVVRIAVAKPLPLLPASSSSTAEDENREAEPTALYRQQEGEEGEEVPGVCVEEEEVKGATEEVEEVVVEEGEGVGGGEEAEVTEEEEEEGESLGTTTLDEHSLLTTPSPSTESHSAENLHEQPDLRPPSTSERILSPGQDEECESLEEEDEVDSGEGEGSGEEEEEAEELEEKVEEDDETSHLPASLELEIKIRKGADPLGLVLETGAVGGGLGLEGPLPLGAWVGRDGALVKEVTSGGAVARDGRIAPGDLILSVNHESLRRIGSAQARTILHRAQLLSTDILIRYIPGKAVKAYQDSLAQQGTCLVGGSAGLQKRPVVPLKLVSPSSPFSQGESLKLSPSKPETELHLGAQDSPLDEGGGKGSLEREAEIVATVLAETPKSISDFEEGDGFVPSPPLQFRLTPGEELTPFEKPSFTEAPSEADQVKGSEDTTMTVTKISQGHSSSNLDKAGGSGGAGYHDGAVGGGKQSSVLLAKHWGPERLVEVLREPNCSLGISIVGGKVDLYNAGPDSGSAISGIFIKNVIPQSPAGRTGELKTGDRILEVDGIDVRTASHERAVEVIRGSGNPVTFLVQSLIQWNDSGEDRQNGATSASSYHSSSSWASTSSSSAPSATKRQSSKMRAPPPPSVPLARTPSPDVIQHGLSDEKKQNYQRNNQSQRKQSSVRESEPKEDAPKPTKSAYSSSEEESDDEEDSRDMEGRILTKKGVEIYRASAGNLKRTKEEIEADPEEEDDYGYTQNKIQKKYAPLKTPGVDVLVATLERGGWGLGISLAGHRDRTKMAVFVAGLNPNGSAAKEGTLKVGDEILEVNGIVLHGRCHLNASAVIKGLAGPVFKVIVLRRSEGVQELAVKPITQFPVSLDDETPEERFANFKGLRSVTIKKGPQGLGIMIIEGKHAEVGQGIFISDIQEGSAAEQAGLIVGDMILQVNKDVIMGSNYDSTASLLKKTEGVVTLVVCNPNKAKEEEKAKDGAGGPAAKKEEEKPKQLAKPSSGTTPTKTSPLSSFHLTSIIKSSHSSSAQRASSCVTHAAQTADHSSKKHSQSAPAKNNTPRVSTNKSTAASSKHPLRPTLLTTPNSAHPTKRNPSPPATSHGTTKSPGMTPEPIEPPPEPPADPATCEIKPGKETTVEINKDNVGLGLSIVGGSDTLLGVIIIHEVYPDGAAAKDGRLKPGDQILEVNSVDFRNITHAKALAALRQTPAKVKMTVYRDESSVASGGKEEDMIDVMDVELAKKAGKGLGLSIVGRKNGPGVFISDVVKGGAAESDGRLMKGDQILAVNGQDLKSASQEEAAAVLKTATGRVTIKLGRLRPRKGAAPEKTTSPMLPGSASSDTSPILPASPPTIITPSPSAAMGPPLRTRTIRLERGPDGLGFSIVGGHGSPHGDLPIYVKTVFDRGSAAKSGGGLGEENRLHRGDQILAVDGVSLDGRTHQEAVALLKGTRKRGSVTLTIAR